jgi:TonB family protein
VHETRRHRLIWVAVGCVHAVALGAVWFGGNQRATEPTREGGVLIISLVSDPIALPGESKHGVGLGAGSPQVVPVPLAPERASHAESVVTSVSGADLRAASDVTVSADSAPTLPIVAEVFLPPAFRVHQEPAYPERARRAGVEGLVTVRISLLANGEIAAVAVVGSSGSRLLDDAAAEAARSSVFTPAVKGGMPVPAEATATYRFELR